MFTLLDGPMGTELARRGADTSGPWWSARALMDRPELVSAIHADYARAGATVHTANTFRTTQRRVGQPWRELTALAVALARDAVPAHHRIAGSIAPLEDCYRPDLSPPEPQPEHRALAEALGAAGVDLVLVETFPHPGEAVAAVRASVDLGLETWCGLSAGYQADLLTPAELLDASQRAVDAGAAAILVNCVPTDRTLDYLRQLADLPVPIGAYANAGSDADGFGWDDPVGGPPRYAAHARQWLEAGVQILGGCCGTGPAHIAALASLAPAS